MDLNNLSSATSTPINCKSLLSSVQNSSLKKRDYQAFNQMIKDDEKIPKKFDLGQAQQNEPADDEIEEPEVKRQKIEVKQSETEEEE